MIPRREHLRRAIAAALHEGVLPSDVVRAWGFDATGRVEIVIYPDSAEVRETLAGLGAAEDYVVIVQDLGFDGSPARLDQRDGFE